MPALAAVVIRRVDARADPAAVPGASQEEITAIRIVGGRVTPAPSTSWSCYSR
jgi:hypothetical protein